MTRLAAWWTRYRRYRPCRRRARTATWADVVKHRPLDPADTRTFAIRIRNNRTGGAA